VTVPKAAPNAAAPPHATPAPSAAAPHATPPPDCPRCPRLAQFRHANRAAEPGWFNAPVPAFGNTQARLLIVGLAPGLRGANRTGRPFTGDHAGILLYQTLLDTGLATGTYEATPADTLTLTQCRIANAVRCVPPENRPLPSEIATCNEFLRAEIEAMPNLAAILALGVIAHQAVLRTRALPQSRFAFRHGAQHRLDSHLTLADSYHVSRYNTSTRRLTSEMFREVVEQIKVVLF
jgi:uracil-DNA glycosylase